jgi:hypothetical protein
MKTIFYIDGGAGRVIAAIPALLKYHRLNPNTDWNVFIPAWDALYWSIPELQDRTFGIDTKGLWSQIASKADQYITPEPYRVPGYFNQKLSLAEAFDQEINNTTDHSDLTAPILKFNLTEEKFAANTIADVCSQQKKTKTIVVQPFGRGAILDRNEILDTGSRSFTPESYLYLMKKLSKDYNLIFFGEPQFNLADDTYTIKMNPNTDLRTWAAIIEYSDYFVGIDSVGQHMARALNKPGTVIFGSTFPINTSYPSWFQIIEKPGEKKYSPLRITGLDTGLVDRLNEGMMYFTDKELDDIYKKIVSDIKIKVK